MAGMEGVGNDFCFHDPDGDGESAVEGALEVFGRDGCLQGKAGHLRQGMHAGVGAAGALGKRRFARDAAEGGLQFSLDGGLAGLNLPAAVIGAVVGEGELPGAEIGWRLRLGLGGGVHGNRWVCGTVLNRVPDGALVTGGES